MITSLLARNSTTQSSHLHASTTTRSTLLRLTCSFLSGATRRLTTLSSTESSDVTSNGQTIKSERPRRCLFSVPGADERKMSKAMTLEADAVVLDLEDGVAYDCKDQARDLVRETLLDHSKTFGKSELCVRINALDTGALAVRDLQAVLPCDRLQAIVIPKVETASAVHFVGNMLDALAPCKEDVRLLAAVESAKGILNLREIAATAADDTHGRKLDSLIFASEDYCADIGAIRTVQATELLYARSQLLTCAKAYNLQAIDMVHIHFRDLDALRVECQAGRELGFTGKQAIHPGQVEIIQEYFSPSTKDVEYASRIVQAYEETTARGQGACVVDGIVVDMPVYKWAVQIMNRAKAAGMLED